jgi:hypothetical protein
VEICTLKKTAGKEIKKSALVFSRFGIQLSCTDEDDGLIKFISNNKRLRRTCDIGLRDFFKEYLLTSNPSEL